MSATDHEWVVNGSGQRSRFDLQLSQIWHHRELAYFFADRDVRVRYKQAVLGALWAILAPLVSALAFTLVFNRVAGIEIEGVSYFAFAIAGSVTWTYASSAISVGTSSLLANGELLTKVAFPRLILPVASVLPGLIDLAIGLIVALIASIATGSSLSVGGLLLGLPSGLVLLVLGAAGPMLYFSAKVVKYRDVMMLVAFGIQLVFFLTPIAYPPSQIPGAWQTVAYVNPITGAVGLIRAGLVGTPAPTYGQLALSIAVAALVFVLALVSFRGHEREFADVI